MKFIILFIFLFTNSLIFSKNQLHYFESSHDKILIEYSNDLLKKTTIDFEKELIKEEIIEPQNKDVKKIKKTLLELTKKKLLENENVIENKLLNDKNSKKNNKNLFIGYIFGINSIHPNFSILKKLYEHIKVKIDNHNNFEIALISIKFPKLTLFREIYKYKNIVDKNAKENLLPSSLIFSIIENESDFNPLATSNSKAYGLMQIVPNSAGKDITKVLEGKERILTPLELYNEEKNIKYGSFYLHLLYYKYLKSIKNKKSRIYCTIAAYNTGTGNVAKAFIPHSNIKKASKIINQMNSQEVYQLLIQNLPYKETRVYLKKVIATEKHYLN